MRKLKLNSDTFLWAFGIIFSLGYSFWASGRPGDEAISGLKTMFSWMMLTFLGVFIIWWLIYLYSNIARKYKK